MNRVILERFEDLLLAVILLIGILLIIMRWR